MVVGNATLGVGNLTSGTALGDGSAVGAGDYLATAFPMVVFAHTYSDLTDGSQIDVVAGDGDLNIGGATLAIGANSDARLQSQFGSVFTGDVTAGRDVVLDGAAIAANPGGTNNIVATAGDVAIQATDGDIDVTSISGGDDVVLRATGNDTIAGNLTSGTHYALSGNGSAVGAGDYLAAASPIDLFDAPGPGQIISDLTGGSAIDVVAGSSGAAFLLSVGGVVTALGATSDVRLQSQSNSILVTDVTAGGNVTLDARSVVEGNFIVVTANNGAIDVNAPIETLSGDIDLTALESINTGSLFATGGDVDVDGGSVGRHNGDASNIYNASGDIAVKATDSIDISGGNAGVDIVMRAGETISAGALTSGTGVEHVGAGDTLAAAQPMVAFGSAGHTYVSLTDGSDIDVVAGGNITLTGVATADAGESDVRLQSLGDGVYVTDISASRDILIDAATSVGHSDGCTSINLTTETGDIAIWARTGTLTIGSATSGDDIILRSGGAMTIESMFFDGNVTETGNLTAGTFESFGAGDYLEAASPMSAVGHDYTTVADGSHIDAVAGLTIGGDLIVDGVADAPGGDVRLQAEIGSVLTGNVTAGRDVVIDAHGDVDASTSLFGPPNPNILIAQGRDVAIWAHSGEISITSASAGDDLIMRAGDLINVDGSLTSGTSVDALGAADFLIDILPMSAFVVPSPSGPVGHDYASLTNGSPIDLVSGREGSPGDDITIEGSAVANGAGSDVRLQSLTGSVITGNVTAGRDVLIDAADGVNSGFNPADNLVAIGGDVAVRAGDAITIKLGERRRRRGAARGRRGDHRHRRQHHRKPDFRNRRRGRGRRRRRRRLSGPGRADDGVRPVRRHLRQPRGRLRNRRDRRDRRPVFQRLLDLWRDRGRGRGQRRAPAIPDGRGPYRSRDRRP